MLENRPTFILEEPIVKSLRRRYQRARRAPVTPEISPEAAVRFVENWATRLVGGWVESFFGDLPEEEKRELKERMRRAFLKKVLG